MVASREPWRYVIVAACAFTLFFLTSFNFAHGVLFVALTDTGLHDVSTVTWLLSITNMMHALGGPLGSVLVNLTSCRTAVVVSGLIGFLGPTLSSCTSDMRLIFVTYGLLLGLARGISISGTTVAIGYWFKDESSLPSGLMFSGVGIGMLVHPRLVQALVDEYSVDGALLLMGAISFHACICGLFLRPSDFEKEKKQKLKDERTEQKENFRKRVRLFFLHFKNVILTNYSFLFFVLGVSFMMMAFSIIITFMPDYLNLQGSTPQEAALAASVLGSGSLVSRVLAGIMTNDANIGTIILFEGNCGISAIFTFLLPLMAQSMVGRYIFAFAIGTYLTCLFVIFGPTTLEKVGLENLAYGFGFLFLNSGIVNLIAPPIGGGLLLGACLCGFLSELFKKTVEEQNNPASKVLLPKTVTVADPDDSVGEKIPNISVPIPVNNSSEDLSYRFRETNV